MNQTKQLKDNHLGEKLKGSEYFLSNLERGVDKLILQIKEKNLKESKILEIIGKIFEISNYFSNYEKIQEKTKDVRAEMEDKINQAWDTFNQALNNIKSDLDSSKIRENLEVCVNVLAYTENLSDNLERYFQGISEIEKKFREELKGFFKTLSETTETEAAFEDPKVMIELKLKTLKIFEVAQNFIAFDKVVSQLKEYQDNILLNIQSHCEQIFEDIQTDFGEKSSDMPLLEQHFSNLSIYREKLSDPKYKCYIDDTIKEANDFLKQTMQQIQNDFNQVITEFTTENKKMNSRSVKKLSRGLKYLFSADWVKKYIPAFVVNVQAGFQTTVSDYLSAQRDEFLQFDLRVCNHQKLQEAVFFLDDLSKLKFKDAKILGNDVISFFKDIETHFEDALENVLNIKVDFTRELELANDIFNYLGQFKEIYKIQIAIRKMKLKKNYIEEAEKKLDGMKEILIVDLEIMEKTFKQFLANLKKEDITQKEIHEYCSFIIECLLKFKKISNLNQISKFQNKRYEECLKDYDNSIVSSKRPSRNALIIPSSF